MNPNLEHSEVVTGKNNGTKTGVIAGSYFPIVLEAITLIDDSHIWTHDDKKRIELWFDRYLEWLSNSICPNTY